MEIIYDTSNYGDMIKKNRIEKGYSQNELANKVGVSRQTINAWENGTCVPTVDKQLKLEKLLHFKCEYNILNCEIHKERIFYNALENCLTTMINDDYFKDDGNDEDLLFRDSMIFYLGNLLLDNVNTKIFRQFSKNYLYFVIMQMEKDNEPFEDLVKNECYNFMSDINDLNVLDIEITVKRRLKEERKLKN